MPLMPLFADGHLDLAMNALLYERDQTLPAEAIRAREADLSAADVKERGLAGVGFHELLACGAGGPVAVCATVIARCRPWVAPERLIRRDDLDFCEPNQAHAFAMAQWAYYLRLERMGLVRLLRCRADFDALAAEPGKVGVLLMMEGADPITEPAEVDFWFGLGLRCVSLAHFGHSRWAAGTPLRDATRAELQDGPLAPETPALLAALEGHGMILDLTHLGDQSFAQVVDYGYTGPICATHSACRAICPSPRQMTDEQLRHILARGGVVGIPLHREMLRPAGHEGPVTLDHLADHVLRVCELAGNTRQVALGSDLDGGFGEETTPAGIRTLRDVRLLGPVLAARGFDEAALAGFLGDNWGRFWRKALPERAGRPGI